MKVKQSCVSAGTNDCGMYKVGVARYRCPWYSSGSATLSLTTYDPSILSNPRLFRDHALYSSRDRCNAVVITTGNVVRVSV